MTTNKQVSKQLVLPFTSQDLRCKAILLCNCVTMQAMGATVSVNTNYQIKLHDAQEK